MGRYALLAEQMGDIERLAWEQVWIYADDCSKILRDMPYQKRRRIANVLVAELLEAQSGICPLCDNAIERSTLGSYHVDHIIPFKHGGGQERGNLQVTHPACNQSKGSETSLQKLIPYLEQKALDLC